MKRSKENLILFKPYLADRGTKNTGKPPYTLQAADLDENFQRLIVRVDGFDLGVIEFLPDGTHLPSMTVDLILNGELRQFEMIGQLKKKK